MIIGPNFVWLHFPKCAGTVVNKAVWALSRARSDILFDNEPDKVFSGDLEEVTWHDNIPERLGRDPNFDFANKSIILNFRRLPTWLLSCIHFDAKISHGLVPSRDMVTAGLFYVDGKTLISADDYLLRYTSVPVSKWIRCEFLQPDFAKAFEDTFDLVAVDYRAILRAKENSNIYLKNADFYFTPDELDALYGSNPTWAMLERQLYGDILRLEKPVASLKSKKAKGSKNKEKKPSNDQENKKSTRMEKLINEFRAAKNIARSNYFKSLAPVRLSSLVRRYENVSGVTRKPLSYLEVYEQLFSHIRDKEIRILELGCGSGHSLLIWKDYFPRATIVGLDVTELPTIVGLDLTGLPQTLGARVHYVQGRMEDCSALERAAKCAGGPFDIIIDDASHIGYESQEAFLFLFPYWLKPGGIYAIEAFGTSFLGNWPDGLAFQSPRPAGRNLDFQSHVNGMVGFLKQTIDLLMEGIATGTQSVTISSVSFYPNLAIIKKEAK